MSGNELAIGPGSGHYLGQALLSLLLVVAVIYGLYYLLRRLQTGAWRREAEGPAEVVQTLPLSGSSLLHLVQVGPRLVGIVTGPQGSRQVGEWEADEVLGAGSRQRDEII